MSTQSSAIRKTYKATTRFLRSGLVPFLKWKWEKDPQVRAWLEGGLIAEAEYPVLLMEWQKWGAPSLRPHKAKQQLIARYQEKYHCDNMVETGTYLGDMVYAQLPRFKEIFTIELSNELWKNAIKRFENEPKVNLLQGDSGKVLHELVPRLNGPALFWLDGHYCSGITAKSEIECPIYEELKAIFASPHQHVVLVDDARYFVGKRDYPTIPELSEFVARSGSGYTMKVEEDAIVIVK